MIAAYDEQAHVVACLQSLQTQTHAPLEIVVVDDGSKDATAELASRVEDVRLLRQPHLGAGRARNLGARHATGDILVFVDADMTFPPRFVERLVAPMLERQVAGTFTKEIMVANRDRRWARAHMLGRGLPVDTPFRPGFPDRWENFRAVWRPGFLRVGGFDEVGHGEDVTLGRKLGVEAEAAPGADVLALRARDVGRRLPLGGLARPGRAHHRESVAPRAVRAREGAPAGGRSGPAAPHALALRLPDGVGRGCGAGLVHAKVGANRREVVLGHALRRRAGLVC